MYAIRLDQKTRKFFGEESLDASGFRAERFELACGM